MNLRDSLEIYNTDEREDNKLLDKIYKNVSKNYFPNSNNKYIIEKITNAFSNIDEIIVRFEYENQTYLNEIQKYILGCKINDKRIATIYSVMKEWAIYFPGIGIIPNIKNLLITRYRCKYIVKYLKKEKGKAYQITYLEYLLLIRKLWNTDKESQIKILEEYNKKNNKMLDFMIEYLLNPNDKNSLSIDGHLVISNEYVESLKEEKVLLEIINQIYEKIFKEDTYNNFKDDLNRIYAIQENTENWIDIKKLNDFIPDNNLKLLKEANLVDEVNFEHQRIIKLTEMGFSIATGYIVEEWENDEYFIDSEDIVLIPYNYSPLIISKYLFDKNYAIKEMDFLIFLERIK